MILLNRLHFQLIKSDSNEYFLKCYCLCITIYKSGTHKEEGGRRPSSAFFGVLFIK